MGEYKKLFEPISIRKLNVKNRVAFAPTGMGTAGPNGEITDQSLCHYVARAKGGAGWITVEHSLATYKHIKGPIGFHTDLNFRGMWELSHAIHAFGAAAVVQLSIGLGAQFFRGRRPDVELVAPSPIPYNVPLGTVCRGLKNWEGTQGDIPRELTAQEVEELEGDFVQATLRIKRAGFDGIEIHGAHGYLLGAFISPLSNKRSDKYGGSFEKRLTLPINIYKKTRAAVGEDFILGFRISGDEHVKGGLTVEETCRIASILEKEGIDFIHLSSGRYESLNHLFPDEEGVILSEAQAIKQAVEKAPVICPNVHTPSLAEHALLEGMADVISLSRGLIADPNWPNKAREGREAEITKCLRCNNCLKTLFSGFSLRCAVNPDVGRERFLPQFFPPPLGFK